MFSSRQGDKSSYWPAALGQYYNIALKQYWIPFRSQSNANGKPILPKGNIAILPLGNIGFPSFSTRCLPLSLHSETYTLQNWVLIETSCRCNKCKHCSAKSRIQKSAHKYCWSVFCEKKKIWPPPPWVNKKPLVWHFHAGQFQNFYFWLESDSQL